MVINLSTVRNFFYYFKQKFLFKFFCFYETFLRLNFLVAIFINKKKKMIFFCFSQFLKIFSKNYYFFILLLLLLLSILVLAWTSRTRIAKLKQKIIIKIIIIIRRIRINIISIYYIRQCRMNAPGLLTVFFYTIFLSFLVFSHSVKVAEWVMSDIEGNFSK